MLNVTNNQGNANQNHNELSSHLSECLLSKRQVLARMRRKENPCALLVGMLIGTVTIENSMEAPQKIKNKTTIQFSDFTPGYLSKENENTNSKRYMHPYVHCSIIYNSQDMEAT